ncbi:ABC transporter, ATP-binding protein [Lautropia mirabilis ATCC 51599]|uniref:ABC transporter, ATP-binding protein n=2 Tax=Lautropia mirabilis TaxID=47671 RepID=E7RY48_9BURK|nr:ABC transporter, ATP-binding protein [Lautropia mirabilis ATCC 51599]
MSRPSGWKAKAERKRQKGKGGAGKTRSARFLLLERAMAALDTPQVETGMGAGAHQGVAFAGTVPLLRIEGLSLRTPDGRPLLQDVQLEASAGEWVLLDGESGIGKSTLLRTVAGLWPWYEGNFRLDTARVLFVPQRPYLPQDSLRAVLCYPQWGHGDDDRLKAALAQVGLARLQDSLDQVQNWGRVLSGGEQQRISLARVLLVRPQALFLDEATGQLDPQSAAAMVRLLQQALPGALCVAISHQPEVKALFTRRAVLAAAADAP